MKERAIVIIHGFGGNEEEILYLHDYLKQNNMDSFWIRLTGHGGNKEQFSKATSEQWLADVAAKLDELEQLYKQITCVGFSMGGLLTIHASKRASVDQIILCSTPIYLYNPRTIAEDLVQGLFFKKEDTLNYYFSSATSTSVRSCFQFLSLLQQTKKLLNKETQAQSTKQALIIQNRQDETTYYKSAYYLAKTLNADVSVKIYEKGRHQLFLGANKEQAVNDIKRFIIAGKLY